MDLGLAGKVAIVTGSSRGIGRGIATRLADEGANVVLCARGGDELDATVGSITAPGRAIGVVADVTTAAGAAAVVEAAVQRLGGVDIVVNNVGGSGAKTFADMDAADLQAVLDKNLFPAVNVSHAALPSLRSRGGGVIAMISSIWGREGGGAPSYNIAKAAEISLAKAMATDLAKDGVRVFSVAPGSTLFPGGSWERRIPGGSERDRRIYRARTPLRAPRNRRRDRRRRHVHGVSPRIVGRRNMHRRRRRPVTLLLGRTGRRGRSAGVPRA